MKVRTCCCCVSVEMGVMLLGCQLWFGSLEEFKIFHPLRLVATLTAGVLFLTMVFEDSKGARERFFYAFLVQQATWLLYAVYDASS